MDRSLQRHVSGDDKFASILPDVSVSKERNFVLKAHRVKVLSDGEEVGGAPSSWVL